jgi:hypothetical protein
MIEWKNPKQAAGSARSPLRFVPDTILFYLSQAFAEGALKYGSFNWRRSTVVASTYKEACLRHISKWWNGEDKDKKTKVHHLANAAACIAILLDAELNGTLDDDRPPALDLGPLVKETERVLAHLKKMSEGLNPTHCYARDTHV